MNAGTTTTPEPWPDIPTDAEGRLVKVVAVSAIAHGIVRASWTDGVERDVDISAMFDKQHPLFSQTAQPEMFTTVRVGEFGGLEWANGMDYCTHALRLKADEQNAARATAAE